MTTITWQLWCVICITGYDVCALYMKKQPMLFKGDFMSLHLAHYFIKANMDL